MLPQADETLRRNLAARLASEGVERLAEELRTLDPAYYAEVDRSNPARVVRALEVCLLTGLPYSQLRTGMRRARWFDIVKVGVDMPRGDKKRRNTGKCEHIPGLLFSGRARSGRAGLLRMDGRFP